MYCLTIRRLSMILDLIGCIGTSTAVFVAIGLKRDLFLRMFTKQENYFLYPSKLRADTRGYKCPAPQFGDHDNLSLGTNRGLT